jgi:hypothetical protein
VPRPGLHVPVFRLELVGLRLEEAIIGAFAALIGFEECDIAQHLNFTFAPDLDAVGDLKTEGPSCPLPVCCRADLGSLS